MHDVPNYLNVVHGVLKMLSNELSCMEFRGIGKGEKTMSIRSIVKKRNIAFMGLVETKHRKPFKPRMKRLWGNDEYDVCEVFASDTGSGGIVVA